MLIRGVDFGPAWAASGARGFFGEGYWFHHLVPGLNWEGSTFVAKTTTFEAREGNMPLRKDWSPKALFPSCVRVYPWAGHALNAVGLSGPGARELLYTQRWQERTKPFMLSFMAVGKSQEERFEEAEAFAHLIRSRLDWFNAPVGLQVNLSCPNTGHDPSALAAESATFLAHVRRWLPTTPLVAKVNVLFPVELARQLEVDALCVSNTIPWGALPHRIDWCGLFNVMHSPPGPVSPLWDLGGGGLSGAPLLPLVAEWIEEVRQAGFTKHVNGCGGILRPGDVDVMVAAGADSVSLGTCAMLRGWRLRSTIKRAKELLS